MCVATLVFSTGLKDGNELNDLQMRYVKSLLLLGLISSFYTIQISYNGAQSSFLGEGIIYSISSGIFLIDSFLYLSINTFFITWFIFYKKMISLALLLLTITIWIYWYHKYSGAIDEILYLKTSIPFVLLISFATIITLKKNYFVSKLS